MDLSATLQYYQKLLIIQYRLKPKAQNTIELMANQALCDGLPFTLARCFDLDVAIGAQLDILGRIVGVPRYVYGLDLTHTFFSFVRYNDTTTRPGFGRYNSNPYPGSIWLRYISNSILQMTDFEMQACIRLKIIQNNSYSSLKDIGEALWDSFGSAITIVDHQNMSITYYANGDYLNIITIAEYLGILPKPMGVSITAAGGVYSSSSCSSSSSCRSSSSSSQSRSSSSSSCRSSSSSSSRSHSSSSSSSSSTFPAIPIVSFLSPLDGSTYTPYTPIQVSVSATELGGTITDVKLYITPPGGSPYLVYDWGVGSNPYNYQLGGPGPPGTYQLTAIAKDSTGQTSSASINIIVINSQINPV